MEKKHIQNITENDDSVTITFGKSDGDNKEGDRQVSDSKPSMVSAKSEEQKDNKEQEKNKEEDQNGIDGNYDFNEYKMDEKLIDTALRETQEEIGINKTSISIIGTITPLFVPVTGFMINPFIGYSLDKLEPIPDPIEVEEIFSVNISDLLNEANRTTKKRNIRGYDVEVPYFYLNNYEDKFFYN